MRYRPVIVYISIIFLLISYGCEQKPKIGGDTGSGQKAESNEIIIGAAGPMTGDQSKMGQDMKNGVTLAVEKWNKKGGVLGKKIKLMVEDDQHDPKQAVSIANKFVNSNVAGVIGHWNSSASIPASTVYHRGKIPMITPASTNPTLTEQGFFNVFRVCGRDDQQGNVAAQFVIEKLKTKNIAILHDKTTYGQGLSEEFQKFLAEPYNVLSFTGIIQGDKDFRGVLTSVISNKPDLIFFGGIYPEAGMLAKQSRELGYNGPFLSGDGVIDQKYIEIAGKATDNTFITFSPDPVNIPFAQDFLKEYHERYGQHGPYSIYAYDAANILLGGIEKAGSIDGQKVAEAIRNIKYEGALGTIEFNEKGDVKKSPYVVWITKDGKFTEYWKPEK